MDTYLSNFYSEEGVSPDILLDIYTSAQEILNLYNFELLRFRREEGLYLYDNEKQSWTSDEFNHKSGIYESLEYFEKLLRGYNVRKLTVLKKRNKR